MSTVQFLLQNKVRKPKCARCLNHGVISCIKGHKKLCRWKDCSCPFCQLVVDRRKVSVAEVAFRRQISQVSLQSTPDRSLKIKEAILAQKKIYKQQLRTLQQSSLKLATALKESRQQFAPMYSPLLERNRKRRAFNDPEMDLVMEATLITAKQLVDQRWYTNPIEQNCSFVEPREVENRQQNSSISTNSNSNRSKLSFSIESILGSSL